MKKPIILLLGVTLSAMSYFTIIQRERGKAHENEEQYKDNEGEEEEREKAGIDKELTAWFQSRGFPDPSYMGDKYLAGWEYAKELKNKAIISQARGESINGSWVSLGPNTGIGGRVLTIAINPTKSTSVFIGSASGGIWKSYNGATSWKPVTTGFPVLGVASIIINPADTNVIYAGTGEVYRMDTSVNNSPNPNPNNTGYNVWKTRGTFGVGILKSRDGGATWRQVLIKSVANLFAIQRLRFNPLNPKTIYACATDGLYRTRDSGANWTRILNLAMVTDVVINAKDTTQIVAAVGNLGNTVKGIYRTTNDGVAWAKIVSALPASFRGFIKLDNVSSLGNRDTIIASIGVDETPATPNELYRSADFGATWAGLASSSHTDFQFWSAHTIAINPFATDSLAFAGVSSYKYKISTSVKAATGVGHSDNHDIQFDPLQRGTYYVACDGGIYKTTNGGTSFTKSNTGLAISQFYAAIGVGGTDANLIVGGLQDINTVFTTNGGTTWSNFPGLGGDGASCYVDPNNDNNILASADARSVRFSNNKGSTSSAEFTYLGIIGDSRTGFVSPLAISKANSQVMVVGSDVFHKTTDGAASWNTGTGVPPTSGAVFIDKIHRPALALELAPNDVNRMYASTTPFAQADNDIDTLFVDRAKGADILRTTDGGATLPFTSIKTNLPDRYVLDMFISPTNKDSVWVTLGGFGTAHVYVTGNAGASPASNVVWIPKDAGPGAGGLPDVPANAIIRDPVNTKVMYVGNDLGIYVTGDQGVTWQDFNNGLWDAVMVYDLRITADTKLMAATHGKGIFKSDLFSGSVLPVRLLDFGGNNSGTNNQLHWTISQEQNLLQYELERSIDGSHFQRVAILSARNSQTETRYNYNDPVGLNNAEYYYRLKMKDIDGSYTYSAVVFIRVANKNNFNVVGNPFRDYVVLNYTIAKDQKLTMRVYSSSGAFLKEENYAATAGTGSYTLYGLSNYPPGMYLLKLESGGYQQTFKLIKN